MANFKTLDVAGWDAAIIGMRAPMKSWNKIDSKTWSDIGFVMGPADYKLAKSLCQSGTEHRKWMRQIQVWVEIDAPRYFWSEFDTYKIGTAANSESTVHTIMKRPLTTEDFELPDRFLNEWDVAAAFNDYLDGLNTVILRYQSDALIKEHKEFYFQTLKSMLPESFKQKRYVNLNYEVLANMYKQRHNHRLPQWSIDFVSWVDTLPYPEFITGKFPEN